MRETEIYREIGHHQDQIELLQERIAYHLGRISLCESQLAEQERLSGNTDSTA